MASLGMTDRTVPGDALLLPAERALVPAAMQVLRGLSDGNRLRLVQALAHRESYVHELTAQLNLPQPLVSYHLRRLRELGLVRAQRQGRQVVYALERRQWVSFTQPLRDICDMVDVSAD